MNYKKMNLLLRYTLLVWVGCFSGAGNAAGMEGIGAIFDDGTTVENRKPIPEFSIPARTPGTHYVSFIALGDQGTGDSGQEHVARLMNDKAGKDPVDFVITLGDNFYESGVTSIQDEQWIEKFETMYDLPNLGIAFYASLGNHDHVDGNARHQVEYSEKSSKWVMPESYYSFSKRIDADSSVQFFALDTQLIGQRGDDHRAQLKWLERSLKASTATWKIVFGHHPVFSYGEHGNQQRMIALVRPLLEKYKVDVYVSGHDHDRQLLGPVRGVYYMVSGTGSESRNTRYGARTVFAASNLGFAWFRISATELHLQFIDTNGDVEYARTLTRATVSKAPYPLTAVPAN